jgi:hypothetical protein
MVPKKRFVSISLLVWMILMACNLPNAAIAPTEIVRRVPTSTIAPTLTPTLTPTPIADFSITRQTNGVQFGLNNPLDLLDTDLPQPFPEDFRVSTDETGEALLLGQGELESCRIFVFLNSAIQKKACPRASFQGGNASCVEEGSVSFQNCRDHFVSTPSGELQLLGTWALVTYLPESQATIAMVNEGTANLAPVLDIDQQSLGPSVQLEAGEFLYTAPDNVMQSIPGLPSRSPQPVERLPALMQGYDVMPWLDQAERRAIQANVPFPNPEVLTGGPDLVVRVEQRPYDDVLRERMLAGEDLFYTPIRIFIYNRGGQPAEGFKVSADGRASDGTFGRPIEVIGQDNAFYAFVEQGMTPGGEVILDGSVGFPREYLGQTVQIVITVDSCAGEEFVEPYCRVSEQNESNNTSDPLAVQLQLPQ